MIKLPTLTLLFALTLLIGSFSTAQNPRTVQITTVDGVTLYADLFQQDIEKPVIILFHQGGSNARAEYTPIIPTLLENGFNIMAVDQRVGGQIYGDYNRTVAKIAENDFGYCDAYPDLEASLQYIIKQGFKDKIIIWGSSYSATLAIQLGSKNADKVSGILAFSPAAGGPMEPCKPDEYFPGLTVPLLVLRPASEMERESSQNQFALIEKNGHQTFIAQNGVHGSSLLVKERVGNSVSENWNMVLEFLASI